MKLSINRLSLRINGIPCEDITVRMAITDGCLSATKEIAVNDPILGSFPITQDDSLEIQDHVTDSPWLPITIPALIELLEKAQG